MKRPSYDELLLAADWLDENEGDGGEAYSCKAVAKWLREVAEDRLIRSEARQAGVPVARLRRKIAEQNKSLNSEAK